MRGFGYELRGQEEAGSMLAEYVDEAFRLEQAGLRSVKEEFKQPVCVHGVGCGKSALLSHGLSLHQKHCANIRRILASCLDLIWDDALPPAHEVHSQNLSRSQEHPSSCRHQKARKSIKPLNTE